MAQPARVKMQNIYQKIYSFNNLLLAYKKARKGKTKKLYVIEFEKNLEKNLLDLQFELKNQFYKPLPLTTFILRDPKTRKISKSDFRDRVVHHAIVNILEPIFDKTFIYDSCANRKGKGTLFATKRFSKFKKIVSKNNTSPCFVLKADIKHYFQEVEHEILLEMIKRKIADEKVLWLIEKILNVSYVNFRIERKITKGMPLGNLTSQFFANIYLDKFDHFVKRRLQVRYYLRYVDDFILLSNSKSQLKEWEEEVNRFLKEILKLELHPQKSRIISLYRGVDFVGFRNFYHHRLLRKRSIGKMNSKIKKFENKNLPYMDMTEFYQGWQAHAKWASTFKLRKETAKKIAKAKYRNIEEKSPLLSPSS